MYFTKQAIRYLIAIGSILVWSLPANTAPQSHELFRSEVKIDSQQQRDLNRALPQAFKKTLVKLTANPDIAEQPWVVQALKKTKNYLLQYRYEYRTENRPTKTDSLEPSSPVDPSSSPGTNQQTVEQNNSEQTTEPKSPKSTTIEVLYLICEFNEQAVTRLFEEFGIAYWGRSRPTLVVWLLHEDQQQRQIASSEHLDYGTLLPDIANRYGLNLVLPLMDLQEQAEITISHLWLRDTWLLDQASQRYDADGYLLAQVRHDELGQWSAEWLLSINGQEHQWPMQQAADLESLVQQGIINISSPLFALYSHRPLNIHATSDIHIGGIKDMQHYQQAWDYLGNLRGVQHVSPRNFNTGEATFTIEHSGDWAELTRLIELDGTLSNQPGTESNSSQFDTPGFDSTLPAIQGKRLQTGMADYGSTDGHLYSQPKQRYIPKASASAAAPIYYLKP